jgi:hypothetical protein
MSTRNPIVSLLRCGSIMAIRSIAVDQRVSNIESRRFASVEKALVELITNSDESYTRMERTAAM